MSGTLPASAPGRAAGRSGGGRWSAAAATVTLVAAAPGLGTSGGARVAGVVALIAAVGFSVCTRWWRWGALPSAALVLLVQLLAAGDRSSGVSLESVPAAGLLVLSLRWADRSSGRGVVVGTAGRLLVLDLLSATASCMVAALVAVASGADAPIGIARPLLGLGAVVAVAIVISLAGLRFGTTNTARKMAPGSRRDRASGRRRP